MHTLSIDIASHEGHIACVDDDAVRSIMTVGRVTDSELIPLAESVLNDAEWKTSDIKRIACNIGPGGFTSVRLGVTFANAMADQLRIPLAGYHGSSLALARCHGSSSLTMTTSLSSRAETRGDTWWIHSTRRDQLFILGGPWSEPTLATLDDVLAVTKKGVAVTGDLLEEHREALRSIGVTFPEPAQLKEVLPAFLVGLEYGTQPLLPWYGRGI